jgi:hypothetical protein
MGRRLIFHVFLRNKHSLETRGKLRAPPTSLIPETSFSLRLIKPDRHPGGLQDTPSIRTNPTPDRKKSRLAHPPIRAVTSAHEGGGVKTT